MKKENYIKSFAVICIFALSNFAGLGQTYKIAGTGVTKCYGNAGPILCPANPADSFYGQYQGITQSYKNNGDGTISDLNTGLMWIQGRGSQMSWDSTFLMADQCKVGGYNDWRVPTIKELYSLINFNGKSGINAATCIAYLDSNYFQMAYGPGDTVVGKRTIDAQDWSATKYTGLTMAGDTTIFGVNFVDGRIKGYPKYQPGPGNKAKTPHYVRFVRGNKNYGMNNFVDNGDSTITDNATGLMWTKNDAGYGMNWKEALAYVQTKNAQKYLGHSDWRLPHAKELQSIVDYSRSPMFTHSAAIDPVFNCTSIIDEGGRPDFPYFWSSTTHLENMGGVYVAFGVALGWMHMPPTATYYTAVDVHGAGAQRSDPKSGSITSYYLGKDSLGEPCYGLGPQGDVIRINNFVRLVRNITSGTGMKEIKPDLNINIFPNPSNGQIEIVMPENVSEIKIFNSVGQLIDSKKVNGMTKINFEFHENGVYLIQFKTLSGFLFRKVIVNN